MVSDDINRGLQHKHNTLIFLPTYGFHMGCVFTWSPHEMVGVVLHLTLKHSHQSMYKPQSSTCKYPYYHSSPCHLKAQHSWSYTITKDVACCISCWLEDGETTCMGTQTQRSPSCTHMYNMCPTFYDHTPVHWMHGSGNGMELQNLNWRLLIQ